MFRFSAAIAAGMLGGVFSGKIKFHGTVGIAKIEAGGAFALFLIVFFLNPGKLLTPSENGYALSQETGRLFSPQSPTAAPSP